MTPASSAFSLVFSNSLLVPSKLSDALSAPLAVLPKPLPAEPALSPTSFKPLAASSKPLLTPAASFLASLNAPLSELNTLLILLRLETFWKLLAPIRAPGLNILLSSKPSAPTSPASTPRDFISLATLPIYFFHLLPKIFINWFSNASFFSFREP
ncbi:Uncharacterised protein [Staphylococcus aureus]|nr:Uncharacterised protein [Staphylococcus aureus]